MKIKLHSDIDYSRNQLYYMRSDIALQLYSPSASLGKIAAQFLYLKNQNRTPKSEVYFDKANP